jgi:hypothetical protein
MTGHEQGLSGAPAPCPDGCGDDLTVHSAGLGCWLCDCTHGREPEGRGPGGGGLAITGRDSILTGTAQQAARLLTRLESGYRAAYQAARQAEGTPGWGQAISTAAEVHRHWAQAMGESCRPGMRQPAEPLREFAARAGRESEPEAEAG